MDSAGDRSDRVRLADRFSEAFSEHPDTVAAGGQRGIYPPTRLYVLRAGGRTRKMSDMSDKTRASLPELALGSAVLAADAARGLVRRAAGAGADAWQSGKQTATAQVRDAVAVPLGWAETTLIPKVIDDLMPYLVDNVVPRIIDGLSPYLVETVIPRILDGAMPQIREKVLPMVIHDLTQSPELRDLITEQSRDVVADAATDLREGTAAADDRLESGFRRLFHLAPAQ